MRLRKVSTSSVRRSAENSAVPGGQPYFAMKWVRGVTLEDVLVRLRRGDPETEAKFPRRRLLTAFHLPRHRLRSLPSGAPRPQGVIARL